MANENKQSSCNGNCSSCSSNCEERDLHVKLNEYSTVRRVIGVVSGKGGVGKSTVTSLLSACMQSRGFATAILDADVTGPSIPKAFGLHERLKNDAIGLIPAQTRTGIKVVSVNLLLENEESPVVWRGPVISGVIQQFWTEVCWGDVDYMFIDMPPGTGDVPLTVFQSIPLDGIVVVTTPQDLVTMIVKKAYNMAQMMKVPVLGLIENMSYMTCPDCGKRHAIFGESKVDSVAEQLGVPVLAKLPIEPQTATLVDKGSVELAGDDHIAPAAEYLIKTLPITEEE